MIHALFYRIEFKRFSHDLAAAAAVVQNNSKRSVQKSLLCFVTSNLYA